MAPDLQYRGRAITAADVQGIRDLIAADARDQSAGVVVRRVRRVALDATQWHAVRCDLPRPAPVVASRRPHCVARPAVDDPEALATAHERGAGLDRYESDRDDAARARRAHVPPGAPHAGRRPLQQPARAVSLSRLPATRRRAPEVCRRRRRSPGGVPGLGIGARRPRAARSLHRLDRRGAPSPHSAPRLQSPLSDSSVGARAPSGVARARAHGGDAVGRVATPLRPSRFTGSKPSSTRRAFAARVTAPRIGSSWAARRDGAIAHPPNSRPGRSRTCSAIRSHRTSAPA